MTYAFNNQKPASSQFKREFRSPRRITITLPYGAYQRLLDRSDQEGRSLSNLAAFLLECSIGNQNKENSLIP